MHVSFEDAQAAILAWTARRPAERIALADAFGRVLREDVIARDDLVPFVRSAMDGFAIRAADSLQPGGTLSIIPGPVYAGSPEVMPLAAGGAVAIATGGALPPGADAVVPIERVTRSNGSIRIAAPLRPGDHVFPAGDDAKRGDTLARAGERITPGKAALLASAGAAQVAVSKTVRVALFCTGDELVEVTASPQRGQVRNSNLTFLDAALRDLGAMISVRQTLPDDPARLEAAFAAALRESDLIVTTGGASVGERDFVKATFEKLGVAFAFRSVAMRPGRPSAFGTRGDCAIAVLPGNPSAVFVGFHELIRLCVGKQQGLERVRLPRVTAAVRCEIHAKPERTYFPFVQLRQTSDGFEATLAPNQCSALNRNAAQTNGIAVVPAGTTAIPDGSAIAVDVFDWSTIAG
jgi:molybdopterin molybdotransferase